MILNEQKILMLECFISNSHEKITASQTAKKHKLNQKSVYLFFEQLETQGILMSEEQGKNKLYSLNQNNKELIKQFLCAIEHLRTLFFYNKNPNIKFLAEHLVQHIKGIAAIFGSYAKSTQKATSDLDLFIIGKFNEKEILQIANTFNIEVNIKHKNTFKEDTLTKEIKKHHILIKNTEKFIQEANTWIN